MKTKLASALAALALTVGLGLSPALHAQEASGSAAPQNPGMSDHDRMMGNEVRGMTKMMDECSRMMQSMNDRRGATSPDQPQGTPP